MHNVPCIITTFASEKMTNVGKLYTKFKIFAKIIIMELCSSLIPGLFLWSEQQFVFLFPLVLLYHDFSFSQTFSLRFFLFNSFSENFVRELDCKRKNIFSFFKARFWLVNFQKNISNFVQSFFTQTNKKLLNSCNFWVIKRWKMMILNQKTTKFWIERRK